MASEINRLLQELRDICDASYLAKIQAHKCELWREINNFEVVLQTAKNTKDEELIKKYEGDLQKVKLKERQLRLIEDYVRQFNLETARMLNRL